MDLREINKQTTQHEKAKLIGFKHAKVMAHP